MKKCIYILILLIFICFFLLFIYEPKQKETLEIARRHVAVIRQKLLYSKISEFYEKNNKVPESLNVLVEGGLVEKSDIFAPPVKEQKESIRKFDYFPESYGDPNAILLSDKRIITPPYSAKVKTVIIETYGDGKIIRREPESEVGSRLN